MFHSGALFKIPLTNRVVKGIVKDVDLSWFSLSLFFFSVVKYILEQYGMCRGFGALILNSQHTCVTFDSPQT